MNIALNFFDIKLSKNHVTIPYLNFINYDQLTNLRNNNPKTIFLPSKSRNKIFFWGNNSISAEGTEEIDKNENNHLFSNILAHSLLQQFYQTTTKIKINKKFHIYKITFFDKDISNNKYPGLELYKTFHLHFTPFYTNSNTKIGFTVSTSITGKITWSIQDFESEGIPYYDLRYDKETTSVFYNSTSVYRLANHFNYAEEIKFELDRQNAIQNEFKEINEFVKTYFKNSLDSFILPDSLEINAINNTTYTISNQQKNFKIRELSTPECYFYNGAYPKRNYNFSKRRKIEYNKPFTYDEFENKTINISIIYPKTLYEKVGTFFIDVQKELINIFKFKKENIQYTKCEIENFALKSYQKKLAYIEKTNLVIIVVDKSHEILKPKVSPYYFCKSEFIKRGINTQEVQIQKIQKFLYDKEQDKPNYMDHNIALNIYAKLGGMAWTIKPSHRKNELIIGVGATTNKEGQPILGLTTIFRGDGKYILGKASSVTNMSDYKNKLEQVISSTIENCIQDGILDTDETFYLIFHIFKRAGKNNEIKALERVINKFSKYSFEHAFVHIGRSHNYRFFMYKRKHQNPQFELKRGLGQNLRGTFIQINRKRAFLGLHPNTSAFYKIDIHKNSSFVDLEYIAEQIYQFTEISHTSYNLQGTPVTIKYPNLMAGFVEKFNEGNLTYLDEITIPNNSLWFI